MVHVAIYLQILNYGYSNLNLIMDIVEHGSKQGHGDSQNSRYRIATDLCSKHPISDLKRIFQIFCFIILKFDKDSLVFHVKHCDDNLYSFLIAIDVHLFRVTF